jgi:PIN domain nuclease of toxin-antitoxin system
MQKKTSPVILDTHVLLWSVLEPSELTPHTKQIITMAQEEHRLFIASISLWEISMLQFKKRLHIYEPIQEFLHAITHISGLSVKDLSAEIAAESILLTDNFHGDPADRMIVATAKIHHATLLTRDQKILSWAKLGSIRALEV